MWFNKSEKKLIEKPEKEEKEYAPLRIKTPTWRLLNSLRGYNGCKSFDDVIMFLYLNYKKQEDDKEEEN